MPLGRVSAGKLVVLLLLVIGTGSYAGYHALAYYVWPIRIQVPVLGEIDTGVTRHQLARFQAATEEYRAEEAALGTRARTMNPQDFERERALLVVRFASDSRVTQITGRPARRFLSFLVRALPSFVSP